VVFVAGTATLAAATDRTLLTWSLTTLTPQWSVALCCHSLAPHPTAGRFAALVAAPTSLNDDNEGEKGEKGDKKGHKGGKSNNSQAGRHVFLFAAASATPEAAWAVRGGGGGAALCMLPTSHAFHETVGAGDAAVVLTHDRRLLMAPFGGDVSLRTPGTAAAEATAAAAAAGVGQQRMVTAPSAFTAAFGRLTPSKKAKAAAAGGTRAMGGGGAAAAAKQLLDVPSHVLPSVLSLCPAFLSALLEESEPCLA
jgi:hypothetical protein